MKPCWWVGRLWAAGWIVCAMMLAGCGDGHDDQEEVQTVVVTNVVDGTVVTNVVIVPAPANDTNSNPGAVAPAAWNVTGNWSGTFQEWAGVGRAEHMELDLHQNRETVTGQYAAGDRNDPVVGNLTGKLRGDQMTLPIVYRQGGVGLDLSFQGQVTANGTVWKGLWWDRLSASSDSAGTFAFQKSR